MALLLAAALAAWLAPARPARAEEGSELLRPLAVDLRRLYPDLARRWDAAELGRFARARDGFRPVSGFLAVPDAPRAELPARASGVESIRRGSVTVRRRLVGAKPAAAVAEAGLLRYRGAYDRTETLFVAGEGAAEPMFLMAGPGSPSTIASAVSVEGGRLRSGRDGGLVVRDARGAAALRLPAPVVTDARGRQRKGTWSLRGGRKGDYTVVLSFDPSGLAYPLLVQ